MGSNSLNYMIVWHMSSGWENLDIWGGYNSIFSFILLVIFPLRKKAQRFVKVLLSFLESSNIHLNSQYFSTINSMVEHNEE